MANRYFNPVTKPSESGAMGNFQEGAPQKPTRFTSGGHMPPTKNPAQPHLGLNLGAHTHAGATRAVNDMCKAPALKPGTQATLQTPAAEPTPKSMANRATNIKAVIRNDQDHVELVNPPKGRSNGD